jgi:hypothetical protein
MTGRGARDSMRPMRGRPLWVLAVALAAFGCSFDKSALHGSFDGGPVVDAAPDVTPPDATGEDGGSCVQGHRQCSGPVVQQCVNGRYEQVEVCALGCKVDEARCYTFTASNVADGALDFAAGDLVIDASGNQTLDVTSGILSTGSFPGDVLVSTETQAAGNPELFIIRCRNFTIGPNTRLAVVGTRALVVLASGEISIEGVLEVSADGSTGGPGGFGGGARDTVGYGPGGGGGGGKSGTDSAGGGGGGNGVPGGAGGIGGGAGAAAAGPGTADRTLRPLYGGSGGGGGAAAGDPGGGGGGAVQLSAAVRVQVTVSGSIRALGGGGGRGTAPTLSDFGAGAGGGSGGSVLLEAPDVTVTGSIAMGGGGGGGGGGTPDLVNLYAGAPGSPGLPSGAAAPGGGPGVPSEGTGGAGGSIGAVAENGTEGAYNGGGGGGAAGRALFASKAGHALLSSGLSPSESGGLTAESTLAKK